jgi:hypothetical protein
MRFLWHQLIVVFFLFLVMYLYDPCGGGALSSWEPGQAEDGQRDVNDGAGTAS